MAMKTGTKVVGLNGRGAAGMRGVVVIGEPKLGQFGLEYILVRWEGPWEAFGASWVVDGSVVPR